MELQRTNRDEAVVKIGRDLVISNSHELKKALLALLDESVRKVVLDFSETQSVDSSGLGKLLLFNEKFRENGGSLKIRGINHKGVVELFKLIQLEKIIDLESK